MDNVGCFGRKVAYPELDCIPCIKCFDSLLHEEGIFDQGLHNILWDIPLCNMHMVFKGRRVTRNDEKRRQPIIYVQTLKYDPRQVSLHLVGPKYHAEGL